MRYLDGKGHHYMKATEIDPYTLNPRTIFRSTHVCSRFDSYEIMDLHITSTM